MISYIFLLFCVVLCAGGAFKYVAGLTLEGVFSTEKPRVRRTTSLPGENVSLSAGNLVSPAPTSSGSFYRLKSTSGATCILLKTDALLVIKYNDYKHGERVEADIFVPEWNLQISGNCRHEDTETMTMAFRGFKLIWDFAKTPGGERWYVSRLQLIYNTDNRLFEHEASAGVKVELSTKVPALLFPTPVGKSCAHEEIVAVLLQGQDQQNILDHEATLLLRVFQLQAFMYNAGDAFDAQFQCALAGSVGDETAPITVCGTLIIAVLFTVTGYGIFRYLEVNKVQRNEDIVKVDNGLQ